MPAPPPWASQTATTPVRRSPTKSGDLQIGPDDAAARACFRSCAASRRDPPPPRLRRVPDPAAAGRQPDHRTGDPQWPGGRRRHGRFRALARSTARGSSATAPRCRCSASAETGQTHLMAGNDVTHGLAGAALVVAETDRCGVQPQRLTAGPFYDSGIGFAASMSMRQHHNDLLVRFTNAGPVFATVRAGGSTSTDLTNANWKLRVRGVRTDDEVLRGAGGAYLGAMPGPRRPSAIEVASPPAMPARHGRHRLDRTCASAAWCRWARWPRASSPAAACPRFPPCWTRRRPPGRC